MGRRGVVARSRSRGRIVMRMCVIHRSCRCAIIMDSVPRIVLFLWAFVSVIWERSGLIALSDILLFLFNYFKCLRKRGKIREILYFKYFV